MATYIISRNGDAHLTIEAASHIEAIDQFDLVLRGNLFVQDSVELSRETMVYSCKLTREGEPFLLMVTER